MTSKNALPRMSAAFQIAARGARLRRFARHFSIALGALLVISLLAAGCGLLWLRSVAQASLPVLDGSVQAPGLSAPVTVARDAHGVPHIQASSEQDLFLAQGYVTAQDRLWQMDALRRNADGELAAILGPSMVEHDKAQRILQFKAVAERLYLSQPAAEKARLDAYARGVNAFIQAHGNALPPEFRLLGYQPAPWTGADSLAVGLLVVQMLDTHWEAKLAHLHVAERLKDDRLLQDLYPLGSWRDRPPTGELHPHGTLPPPRIVRDSDDDDSDDDEPNDVRALPPGLPVQDLAVLDLPALRAAIGLPTCEGCQPGSNNWVVSGAHTASGRPLLANDMHLGLMAPNIWYMADLQAPGYHAAGVTLPGMPFVIQGHNEHIAWGITALMGDVQDLYEEKLDGKGNFERNDKSWAPLRVDHQTIKVRGGHDVALDVQLTDHGPLLNPILPKGEKAYALKWTLFDEHLSSMPIYRVNTAANWTEFSAALADWAWPTLNIVYADDAGHIGYHAVGRIPIHFPGTVSIPYPHITQNLRYEWGDMLANASGHGSSWVTYIPFTEMPNAFDPPSGFLATANARVTSEKSKYAISSEWIDPYRVERIYKMLEGRDGLTPQDMLAAQTDVYSEVDQELGQRFAYALEHTPGADARLKQAAKLLHDWDGRLTTDSAAASIVTQTRRALWPMILQPKLGKSWTEYEWGEKNFAEEEMVMHARAAWLPKVYKNWDELLTAAVRKALADNKAPADLSQWSYGSWHVVDIEHPLGRFLPFAGRRAGTGELPLEGDTTTVKQVGRAFGPSQRFTMDWSNVDGSTQNIVLGESGNPMSPYYRDQWNAWYTGTTFALPFTGQAVAAQTLHTLRLKP
jgi:penicillin amidase